MHNWIWGLGALTDYNIRRGRVGLLNSKYLKRIESLYLRMYNPLFEYARSSLLNDALAEEAVQETFCVACKKPELLYDSKNPEGWIVNTLKNVIANIRRRQAIANHILSGYIAERVDEISSSRDCLGIDILYEDVAKSDEFKLLKEIAIDGKSYFEIASAREITVAASRKRVQRAKEVLRKKLKK